MAELKFITRSETSPIGKPRILFTCHPDDFDVSFEKITKDIFRTHDCAIYYTEDMSAEVNAKDMETWFSRSNLIVFPITSNFLRSKSRAGDRDLPYAIQQKIPILPILMEPDIEGLYANNELLHEIQYLNPFSTDPTEIPYSDKLDKYLDMVLFSEELEKRIRAAFDAYVFLSYRKIDRYYANELMRMIHRNPECQSIAIWFDEYLIPGESFSKIISEMLDKSELFTLLVTPNLLEKRFNPDGEESDNYVLSVELPLAKEKGKPVFAVEMVSTDKKALESKGIYHCVNPQDEAEFRSVFMKLISRIATTTDENNPEHTYLIGLAYLNGIDVEVDRKKGVDLIQKVAEAGLEEAMCMMGRIYQIGKGVPRSYYLADEWYKKFLDCKLQNTNDAEAIVSLMEAYDEYCDFLLYHRILSYSPFVNDRMLPYIKGVVQNRKLLKQNREDLLFWLCKSYYRSVQSDMARDADNHNAEKYAKLVKKLLRKIKDPRKIELLKDYLDYMEKAATIWDDFLMSVSVNSELKATEERHEPSEEEIIAAVSKCKEEYSNNPNETTLENYIKALEDARDYYSRMTDLPQYVKYASEYLIQKEKQFYLDPDVIEAMNIIYAYSQFVDRLINEEEFDEAIEIQNRKIRFLEYLKKIGAEYYEVDYSEALELLNELHKKRES